MGAVWTINERKLRWWGAAHDCHTLTEVAAELGVATSTLSRVMAGKTVPGHELLAAVRLRFGQEAFGDIFTAVEVAA